MAEQSIWRRLFAAVEREYERRIRAASLVTEYGAHGHDHHHDDDDEGTEIVNLPRGAGRQRPVPAPHPVPPADHE